MMTEAKSGFPNNHDAREAFGAAILAGLKSYGLRHTQCEDGSSYPLVDALTPPEERNITLGQDELKLLADHLYNELEDALSTLAAAKALQPANQNASPKDVRDVVNAARAVTTWLDWSGGLPTMNGQHMSSDVIALGKAVNEFDSCEVLRASNDIAQANPMLPFNGVLALPSRRNVSPNGAGSEWNAAIDEIIRLNPEKPHTKRDMRWLPRNATANMVKAGVIACGSGDLAQYVWNQLVETYECERG